MSTLQLTASGTIPGNSCVKVVGVNQVGVCTASTDIVVGVTDYSQKQSGETVTLQDSSNESFLLRAGGTITAGDFVVPTTNGSVISAASGQFISTENASSGETLWAQRVGSVEINTDSTRARSFIRDAVNGVDSVDFLIAGDSNTNKSGWGWNDALVYALVNAGANHYSTPLIPVFSRESATFYGYQSKFDAYGKINELGTVQNAAGLPALGNTLARADSAPAGLYDLLRRTSGSLQPNAAPFYFGYFAGSNNWADFLGGIYTVEAGGDDGTDQLAWQGSQIFYRVVHAIGPSFGSFQPSFRRNGGGDALVVAGSRVPCANATYGWQTAELTIPADANRNTAGRQYLAAYADNTWGNYYITGPVALALQSLSRSIKGVASQCLDHYGGATTNTVALDAFGAPTIISQYMREVRARQIARGGTGRVIVMFQGGVNGTGSSTFAADCTMFMETCRTCWLALGYPITDLGFIGLTSHQNNNPDTLTVIRASAATLKQKYTIVNGMDLASYATLLVGSGGSSYFANAITEREHLTPAGYKYICTNLVTALLS